MSANSKFGPQIRQMLASPTEPAAGPLAVLIRVANAPSAKQLERLKKLGAEVRTVAGDVLTANIAADQLDELSKQDFVVSLESSGPLYPESPARQPAFYSDVE
jgi:hypothetical protein